MVKKTKREVADDLERLLKLALKHKARRLRCGELEVELDPSAFAPLPTPANPDDVVKALEAARKEVTCRCGHPYDEHNEMGCLHGCPLGTCAPEKEES